MKAANTTAKIAYADAFSRSSVDPQTIASETAQNANWKIMNAADAPLNGPPISGAPDMSLLNWTKNPESPRNQPAPPNANANPQAHQAIVAIEKLMKIFATPDPTFLPREKPISRNRNPACMKMTRIAETITHVEFSSEMIVGMASSGVTACGLLGSFKRRGIESARGRRRSLSTCRESPRRVSPAGRGLARGRTRAADVWPRGQR